MQEIDTASQSAGWIKELEREHTPETDEYGLSSFVFRSSKPFHPERFWNYIGNEWPANVFRRFVLDCIAARPGF